MFKLTPQYLVSHDQVAFNKFASPHQLLPFKNGKCHRQFTDSLNPVSLFVLPAIRRIKSTVWTTTNSKFVFRNTSNYLYSNTVICVFYEHDTLMGHHLSRLTFPLSPSLSLSLSLSLFLFQFRSNFHPNWSGKSGFRLCASRTGHSDGKYHFQLFWKSLKDSISS